MSREEANTLLRRVRAGFFANQKKIQAALIATGDLREPEELPRRRNRRPNFGRVTR